MKIETTERIKQVRKNNRLKNRATALKQFAVFRSAIDVVSEVTKDHRSLEPWEAEFNKRYFEELFSDDQNL